jgi:integrase
LPRCNERESTQACKEARDHNADILPPAERLRRFEDGPGRWLKEAQILTERRRWEHLDWANKRYFVYESKSPKGRRFVPISPRVRQALLARYSEQKEGWIFPSKRAGSGHLTTFAKQFEFITPTSV